MESLRGLVGRQRTEMGKKNLPIAGIEDEDGDGEHMKLRGQGQGVPRTGDIPNTNYSLEFFK